MFLLVGDVVTTPYINMGTMRCSFWTRYCITPGYFVILRIIFGLLAYRRLMNYKNNDDEYQTNYFSCLLCRRE